MGFFNNLLPLSFQIDPSLGFGDFMRYVKAELLAVMGAQQIPFERLVDRTRVRRAGARVSASTRRCSPSRMRASDR